MGGVFEIEGVFSTADAAEKEISRTQLSEKVKRGELERLARGVYAVVGSGTGVMVDAVVLAKRGTDFVIALESALRVHGITNATPHGLWIAMKRGARHPRVDFPLEIVSESVAYGEGAEVHEFDGAAIKVYCAARTVADLFKFRNRVGMELAIAALKEGLRRRLFTVDDLMRFARLDRVENVIRPYVEGYFG